MDIKKNKTREKQSLFDVLETNFVYTYLVLIKFSWSREKKTFSKHKSAVDPTLYPENVLISY